jgi:hypothetical protein
VKYKVMVFEVNEHSTQHVYECSEEPSADEPSIDVDFPSCAALVGVLAAIKSGRVKRAQTVHMLVGEGDACRGFSVPIVLTVAPETRVLAKGERERLVRTMEGLRL